MSNYLEQRRKHIEDGRPLKEKKKYFLPKVSKKRAAKLEEQKQLRAVTGESKKEKWFEETWHQLSGTCQCGCGRPTSKLKQNFEKDEKNFRSSICHILPQRLFKSVQFHPLNFVERNFWDGCHTNMDNRSIELWPNMADWDDIKAKFQILEPLLSDQERAKKFFGQLKGLVERF